MSKVILNGIQFRQLVSGQAVHIGECELLLGDLGFEILQVEAPGARGEAKLLRFVDHRK